MNTAQHSLIAAIAQRERQADDYMLRSVSDCEPTGRAAAATLAANAVRDLRQLRVLLQREGVAS